MRSEGSATGFKLLTASSLALVALAGGLLPLRLKHLGEGLTSCLYTAAGGVFFATAMVHMLPESSETLDEQWGDAIPWGGLIASVGFISILCLDYGVRMIASGRSSNKGHSLVPTSESFEGYQEHSNGLLERRSRSIGPSDLSEMEMRGISPRALLDQGEETTFADSANGFPDNGSYGLGRDDREANVNGTSTSTEIGNFRRRADDADVMRGRGDRIMGMREVEKYEGVTISTREAHGGHGHGMGGPEDGVWVRIALLLALSVHSCMEGLGVGAGTSKAWNIFIAILSHKGLAGYALGSSLLDAGVSAGELTIYVLVFSMMTPLGILIGALVDENGEDNAGGAVCVSLATGTFIFISLMEMLPRQISSLDHGWLKLMSLVLGFTASTILGLLVG